LRPAERKHERLRVVRSAYEMRLSWGRRRDSCRHLTTDGYHSVKFAVAWRDTLCPCPAGYARARVSESSKVAR